MRVCGFRMTALRTGLSSTSPGYALAVSHRCRAKKEQTRQMPCESLRTQLTAPVLKAFTWKPRPDVGLDCLMCAIFARQRHVPPNNGPANGSLLAIPGPKVDGFLQRIQYVHMRNKSAGNRTAPCDKIKFSPPCNTCASGNSVQKNALRYIYGESDF